MIGDIDDGADTMAIDKEINDANNDITGLKNEIEALEGERIDLVKQQRELEDLIEVEKQKTYNDNIRRKRQQQDDWQIPAIVQHSYFDESISKYFTIANDDLHVKLPGSKLLDLDAVSKTMSEDYSKIIALKQNILYENLYRLSGITAFPLNKEFDPDSKYLGLRFDMFSTLQEKFSTIHYIILRLEEISPVNTKGIVTDQGSIKYVIHKSTFLVPEKSSNILLQNNDNEVNLQTFVPQIRRQLVFDQLIIDFQQFIYNLKYLDIQINGEMKNKLVFSNIHPRESSSINDKEFTIISDSYEFNCCINSNCAIVLISMDAKGTNSELLINTRNLSVYRALCQLQSFTEFQSNFQKLLTKLYKY